jgi:hypothetical protein
MTINSEDTAYVMDHNNRIQVFAPDNTEELSESIQTTNTSTTTSVPPNMTTTVIPLNKTSNIRDNETTTSHIPENPSLGITDYA